MGRLVFFRKQRTELLRQISSCISGSEALSRVRTEFLSVSKCPHLEQLEPESMTKMIDLKTLTMNQNPHLTYIAPGFLR